MADNNTISSSGIYNVAYFDPKTQTWKIYSEDDVANLRTDVLKLGKINKNGTIEEMIDTINSNFQNIASHGGGPAGIDGDNGINGTDGESTQYIYALEDRMEEDIHYPLDTIKLECLFDDVEDKRKSVYKNTTWYDNAQPISKEHPNQYVFVRVKRGDRWYYEPRPKLWAHWGSTGKDGDGVEYIFLSSKKALTEDELTRSIVKLNDMDRYQRLIFGMDDFYPGVQWFNSKNKSKVLSLFSNENAQISNSEFDRRWLGCFGFCPNGDWTDDPVGTSVLNPYEYVSIRRSNTDENDKKTWGDFCIPALWSSYSFSTRTFIIYCNMNDGETPMAPQTGKGTWDVANDKLILTGIPSGWTDTNIDEDGKIVWMCSGLFEHTGRNVHWSKPIRVTGNDGKKGEDGSMVEFIYTLSDNPQYPDVSNITKRKEIFDRVDSEGSFDYEGTVWYDRALPISKDNPFEYVWIRYKDPDSTDWVYEDDPVLWAHWGEDGTDGDGVEYIFVTTNTNSVESLTLPKYSQLNDSQKKLFQIDDFIPSSTWFVDKNKEKAQNVLGSSFDLNLWNDSYGFNVYPEWTDNPISVDVTHQYQWVSIRRSNNDENGKGVWGDFGEPKLWSKYSSISFTAFAFVSTATYEDLSNYQPQGLVSLNDPRPLDGTYNGKTIIWKDGPETTVDKPVVWVTSAHIKEESLTTITWSKPKKMTDTSEFNVEWCSSDISGLELSEKIVALGDDLYNFGTYLANNNNDESAAEDAWRLAVKTNLGLDFSDSTDNAVLMATCQYSGGIWSNWNLVRVKGENGTDGNSIKIVGRIARELYLPDGIEYTKENVTTYFNANKPESLNNGDLVIVYPYEPNEFNIYYGDDTNSMGGALYIWEYINSSWIDYNDSSNGEATYNTYTSINGHLILWDGDSWQDMGTIVGPQGDKYEVLIKYANEENGVKIYASDSDIPSAKWIGIMTYIEGSENPNAILVTDSRWKWSLFKGQDGYGYEYIYKRTDSSTPPNVPNTSNSEDLIDGFEPTGWSDEPMEPTSTQQYVWMCWRKYDKTQGRWKKFMGVDGKTSTESGVARLWQIFVNTITGITEYFHADTVNSPSDAAFTGNPAEYPEYWFNSSSAAGWGLNKKYLFNVEVVTYLNGSFEVLTPHFISMYEDGIKDITDYYCLHTNGATAPAINNGVPVTSGTNTKEGKTWWTTNASKTKISREYEYLWNVSKKTYEGGKEDVWTTPLVVGIYTEGSSAYYADLDNELDSVQIKSDRSIVDDRVCKTKVRMYYGNETLKITKCEVSGEEPLDDKITFSSIPTGGADYVEMTLTLNSGDILPSETHKIVFSVTAKTITGDVEEVSRLVSYTLIGTTHPSVYTLILSDNAIIKGASSMIPNVLSISVLEQTGAESITYTEYNSTNIFKLFVKKNNGTKVEMNSGPFTYTTNGLNVDDKLTFTVEVDTDGNGSHETVLDSETVFVLREGTDGTNGNGYQYRYIRYNNEDTESYGGTTTCTVTQASVDAEPVFKIGSVVVESFVSPQGADTTHTYEYRSERSGYDGNWGLWSSPVIIAKYIDAGDIDAAVAREVATATGNIESTIMSNLEDTLTDVESLMGKFDENGKIKNNVISEETRAGIVSGYLKTSELSGELEEVLITGTLIDGTTGQTKTLSEWINYESGEIRSTNSQYNSLDGQIKTINQSLFGKDTSIASDKFETNAKEHFSQIERSVANATYLKDEDGYLLVEESNGTRRRAKKTNGSDAKEYVDVRPSDRDKLILVVTELASISQTVSDGIAATSIVVNKGSNSAGALFQATGNGSEIAFMADLVTFKSGNNNPKTLANFIKGVGEEEGWGDTSSSSNYDWITNAFSQTNITGGVALTGNVLVADSGGNYTAGMLGANVENTNDLRFFAGDNFDDDIENSPFRVYEDGSLYATLGQIGPLTITEEALELRDDYGNETIITPRGIKMKGSFSSRCGFIASIDDNIFGTDEEVMLSLKNQDIYSSNNNNSKIEAFLNCDIIDIIYENDLKIPSDMSLIGRRCTIMSGHPLESEIGTIIKNSGCSYSYEIGNFTTKISFNDDNCKFYENDSSSSSISLSKEAVELYGIGIGTEFRGFIITNRYNINPKYDYGSHLRCLGACSIKNDNVLSHRTSNGYKIQLDSTGATSITLETPFKVNSNKLNEIVVNIDRNSSSTTQLYSSLSTTNDGQLYVTINGSDNGIHSMSFKVSIFNTNDFISLSNNIKFSPAIKNIKYGTNSTPNTTLSGNEISWSANQTMSYTVKINTNVAVNSVSCTFTDHRGHFTISSFNTETNTFTITPNTTVSNTDGANGFVAEAYIKLNNEPTGSKTITFHHYPPNLYP